MLIALILSGAVAVGVAAFYPEIIRLRSLANQLAEEKNILANEQLVKARREREVHLIKTDNEYLEIIARDRIGVMKEGETIFRLDAQGAPTQNKQAN